MGVFLGLQIVKFSDNDKDWRKTIKIDVHSSMLKGCDDGSQMGLLTPWEIFSLEIHWLFPDI